MNYATVCSGIEAPSVAWEPLGWKPVFFSEIEKFPSAVLNHHWPHVPNYGDMTKFKEWPDHELELICGGTPCQSFSVAGLRKGLADPRGNLALVFLAIVDRYRPRWVVWENVPGVLSSTSHDSPDQVPPGDDVGVGPGEERVVVDEYDADEAHAFGCFVSGLSELGYGVGWSTLDAQFFGVPQRRRRVFVVGYFGDWRPAVAVSLDLRGMSGHPAPERPTGESVAALTSCGVGTCGADDNQAQGGHLIAAQGRAKYSEKETASSLRSEDHQTDTDLIVMAHGQGNAEVCRDGSRIAFMAGQGAKAGSVAASEHVCPTVRSSDSGTNRTPCVAIRTAQTGANGPGVAEDVAHTLDGAQGQAVAFHHKASASQTMNPSETCPTLDISKSPAVAFQKMGQSPGHKAEPTYQTTVRRLVPIECEFLQGFPRNFTRIPVQNFTERPGSKHFEKYRDTYGENADGSWTRYAPDGPRYKALGNSMAVPVVRWIGERIEAVEEILKS